MDAETLRQYRYHRANGGTAEGSLACARTRILLDRAIDENVAEIRWDYEEERYEDVFGFEDDAERKWFYDGIENGSITGPFYAVLRIEGETVASLGMVTLGPRYFEDYYAKLIEVELAAEVEDDLRQALGDALDARQGITPA